MQSKHEAVSLLARDNRAETRQQQPVSRNKGPVSRAKTADVLRQVQGGCVLADHHQSYREAYVRMDHMPLPKRWMCLSYFEIARNCLSALRIPLNTPP